MDIAIIDMLWNPLSGLTSWISDWADGFIQKIVSIFIYLPTVLLYGLQTGFFYVIDCVQTIFRKMAGLDTYYVDGQEQSGDIVMSMLTSQMIINIFIAVLVVSIMLLFVTTFVAIIRVEFTEKGAGNAKGPIIGRAIKSIAYFAVVPVVCLFGVWIANVFLRSFDKATSGNSYSLSTTVFYAAAQDGNRARHNSSFASYLKENDKLMTALRLNSASTQEEIALAIDQAFLARTNVRDTPLGADNSISLKYNGSSETAFYWAVYTFNNLRSDKQIKSFDSSSFTIVFYFYDLFTGYNYMIGYVGGFMAASLLVSSAIGLVQRLYEMAILFVISPAAVAFMPLDDGKKYQSWRGEFVKRVGMMYGPVIGLNLMFQILAVLQHVTLFNGNLLFDALVQLLFLIVGLLSIKEFSGIISNFVGSTDAMQVGEGKKKDVKTMGQRMIGGQMAAARFGKEATKAAYNTVRGTGAGLLAARDRKKAHEAFQDYVSSTGSEKDAAAKRMKKYGEAARDHNASAKKRQGKGIGDQLNMVLHGDAAKTGMGSTFGDLSKAAGPALQYFTRTAIAKRQEEGQTGMGQMRLFLQNQKGEDGKYRDGATIWGSLANIGRSNIPGLAGGDYRNDGEDTDNLRAQGVFAANKGNSDRKKDKDAYEEAMTRRKGEIAVEDENAKRYISERSEEMAAEKLGLDLSDKDSWSATDAENFARAVAEFAEMLHETSAHVNGASAVNTGGAGFDGKVEASISDPVKLADGSTVSIANGSLVGLASGALTPLSEALGKMAVAINANASSIANLKLSINGISTKLDGIFKGKP